MPSKKGVSGERDACLCRLSAERINMRPPPLLFVILLRAATVYIIAGNHSLSLRLLNEFFTWCLLSCSQQSTRLQKLILLWRLKQWKEWGGRAWLGCGGVGGGGGEKEGGCDGVIAYRIREQGQDHWISHCKKETTSSQVAQLILITFGCHCSL